MNRILFEPGERTPDGDIVVRGDRANHILNVLRAGIGTRIRMGQVDGSIGTGTVRTAEAGRVVLAFEEDGDPLVRPRLDLLLAAPRPKVMNRLWAQLAALGVDRIIISNAWKVERYYFDSHVLTPETWRPRLIEGLQQAGCSSLPRVHIARRFNVLVEDELDTWTDADLRVVLHPGEPDLLLTTPLLDHAGRVLVALGPEGGWTEYELDLLGRHQFRRVGMGMRVLRTDTACVGALSIVAQRLESTGGPPES